MKPSNSAGNYSIIILLNNLQENKSFQGSWNIWRAVIQTVPDTERAEVQLGYLKAFNLKEGKYRFSDSRLQQMGYKMLLNNIEFSGYPVFLN